MVYEDKRKLRLICVQDSLYLWIENPAGLRHARSRAVSFPGDFCTTELESELEQYQLINFSIREYVCFMSRGWNLSGRGL